MHENRKYSVLLDWQVLIALALLLANDIYLKYAFPGFMTGKLSDVAGLFVVVALIGRHWPRAFMGWTFIVIAIFAYWKSPLSQPMIDLINGAIPFRIGRTADYTDLIAFLVLPLAHPHFRPAPLAILAGSPRMLTQSLCAGIVAFAVAGTSALPLRDEFVLQKKTETGQLRRDAVGHLIDKIAKEHGMETCQVLAHENTDVRYCDVDSVGQYGFSLSWFMPEGESDVNIRITGDAGGPILLFSSGGDKERIKALRNRLTSAFAQEFGDIQLVVDVHEDSRNPVPLVD